MSDSGSAPFEASESSTVLAEPSRQPSGPGTGCPGRVVWRDHRTSSTPG